MIIFLKMCLLGSDNIKIPINSYTSAREVDQVKFAYADMQGNIKWEH